MAHWLFSIASLKRSRLPKRSRSRQVSRIALSTTLLAVLLPLAARVPAQEPRPAATAKPASVSGAAAVATSSVPAAVAPAANAPAANAPAANAPATFAKTPLRPEDIYRFDAPTQPALSPSGSQAAYIRQWIDPASLLERHSLWTASLSNGGSRSVVAAEPGEPDARLPIYSPDGRWIAIRSTRPRPDGWKPTPAAPPESEPATDIWLLPTQGGPAVPLAGPDKPYGRVFTDPFYGRVAFSPDSQSLVFVADDGLESRTLEEREADVTVVRPDQGEGYTGYGPAQIWVARLHPVPTGQTFSTPQAAAKIERLTQDEIWYGDPQWLPDGRSLVVHANRTVDVESVRFSINKNFDLSMPSTRPSPRSPA